MYIKPTSLLAVLLSLFAAQALGQDMLYSNFTQSPLNINPSLAGHFEGKFRVGAQYRNQWSGIGKSGLFSTPTAFADFNLLDDKMRGSLGAGISVMNEQAAGGSFNTLQTHFSLAYHLALDADEAKHFLSVGLKGGIINESIRTSSLKFASQFDGLEFSGQSGEVYANQSTLAPDVALGLTYANYFAKGNIRVGASYNHVATSMTSFYKNGAIQTYPNAIIGHLEGNFLLNNALSLHPNVLFATQAGTSQINANLQAGFHFDAKNALYVGAGIRTNDAVLALLRLQLDAVNIGFGYDINTSPLSVATRGQGAWEVSLLYSGGAGRTNARVMTKAIAPPVRYY
jgi:type IX secretion system PorP/SprF family membrane protein